MELTEEQCAFFRSLADKYETAAFSASDPCRILTRYTEQADIEAGALTNAILRRMRPAFLRTMKKNFIAFIPTAIL